MTAQKPTSRGTDDGHWETCALWFDTVWQVLSPSRAGEVLEWMQNKTCHRG